MMPIMLSILIMLVMPMLLITPKGINVHSPGLWPVGMINAKRRLHTKQSKGHARTIGDGKKVQQFYERIEQLAEGIHDKWEASFKFKNPALQMELIIEGVREVARDFFEIVSGARTLDLFLNF